MSILVWEYEIYLKANIKKINYKIYYIYKSKFIISMKYLF